MYKVKGIEEKFEKFNEDSQVCKSYGCKFKVFNLWHDVRRTVIFLRLRSGRIIISQKALRAHGGSAFL